MGDASILRLFRLLRLTRMARMARLLRAMPELMVMIKALAVAMRSVFFALGLLLGIIYVFAIAFRQLLDGTQTGEDSFPNVLDAMYTLLIDSALPDQGSLVRALADTHIAYLFLALLFFLLSSITVMNMLIGILCEVVAVVSSVEKEEMLINYVKTELIHMLDKYGIDTDGDNHISQKEFSALLSKPAAARVLQDVGVDVIGLVDFTDFIFAKGDDISFNDFMELVLQLRGSNTATVKDIIDLGKRLNLDISRMYDRLDHSIGDHLTHDNSVELISSQLNPRRQVD